MTIEYMTKQNCLELRYTDAFKYVRAKCNASVLVAVYAWIFGRKVEVADGQQYMKDNDGTTLSNKLAVIFESSSFKTRNIKQTTGKTVSLGDNLHSSDSDDVTTEADKIRKENQEIKEQCVIINNEIKSLNYKVESRKIELVQLMAETNSQTNQTNQTNIKRLERENKDLNAKLKKKIEEVKEIIDRIVGVTGVKIETSDDNSTMTKFIINQSSTLCDCEWKKLVTTVMKNNMQADRQTDRNVETYSRLLKIFKYGENIANNILIAKQIELLSNKETGSEAGEEWDKFKCNFKNDLINNETNDLKDINEAVESHLKDLKDHLKEKDMVDLDFGDLTDLKNYLYKIIKLKVIMALEYSPMKFSYTCNNKSGGKREFDKLDGSELKYTDVVGCVVLPAILDDNGFIVTRGLVY